MAIKVSGSGTALPLVQKLAEAFGKRHPEIRFDFDAGTNTGGGIKGVSAGVFHLAVANRSLSEAESALGLLYRPFGKDPLVFATHEGSGVTAMSSEQIRAVYAGDRTSWDQVGGPKQAIVLLDRDADETARKFGLVPFMMGQSVQAQTIVLTRSKEMADALSSTAHSLGYSTLGHLSSTQVQGVRP